MIRQALTMEDQANTCEATRKTRLSNQLLVTRVQTWWCRTSSTNLPVWCTRMHQLLYCNSNNIHRLLICIFSHRAVGAPLQPWCYRMTPTRCITIQESQHNSLERVSSIAWTISDIHIRILWLILPIRAALGLLGTCSSNSGLRLLLNEMEAFQETNCKEVLWYSLRRMLKISSWYHLAIRIKSSMFYIQVSFSNKTN